MSETYRPGDIAMVKPDDRSDAQPAIHIVRPDGATFWMWLDYGFTYLPHEVGPVLGNVADIADGTATDLGWQAAHAALAQIRQLERWKKEAMPVMDGLQELGKALHIPLGERITGPAALEAVQQLQSAAQAVIDNYDNSAPDWWPQTIEDLREVLNR
jgi:hypothetical protein